MCVCILGDNRNDLARQGWHSFFLQIRHNKGIEKRAVILTLSTRHNPRASNVHIGDIAPDTAREKLSLSPKRKISLTETETCCINKISFWELGIAHMPEGRRLFSRLRVMQNLTLGA
jgi:hypothetical protein